mmetsp:Transcript_24383/g.72319  ORF Transcript_24383/g.72319 Transcript_24383/m.72319 type:complete len:316 (+) Transcript_24383:879-1826(+)
MELSLRAHARQEELGSLVRCALLELRRTVDRSRVAPRPSHSLPHGAAALVLSPGGWLARGSGVEAARGGARAEAGSARALSDSAGARPSHRRLPRRRRGHGADVPLAAAQRGARRCAGAAADSAAAEGHRGDLGQVLLCDTHADASAAHALACWLAQAGWPQRVAAVERRCGGRRGGPRGARGGGDAARVVRAGGRLHAGRSGGDRVLDRVYREVRLFPARLGTQPTSQGGRARGHPRGDVRLLLLHRERVWDELQDAALRGGRASRARRGDPLQPRGRPHPRPPPRLVRGHLLLLLHPQMLAAGEGSPRPVPRA